MEDVFVFVRVVVLKRALAWEVLAYSQHPGVFLEPSKRHVFREAADLRRFQAQVGV